MTKLIDERNALKACNPKNIKWLYKVDSMSKKDVVAMLERLRLQGKAAA